MSVTEVSAPPDIKFPVVRQRGRQPVHKFDLSAFTDDELQAVYQALENLKKKVSNLWRENKQLFVEFPRVRHNCRHIDQELSERDNLRVALKVTKQAIAQHRERAAAARAATTITVTVGIPSPRTKPRWKKQVNT